MSLIRTTLFLACVSTSVLVGTSGIATELSSRLSQALGTENAPPQAAFVLRPATAAPLERSLAAPLAAPSSPLTAPRPSLAKKRGDPAATSAQVDESALRFYASQNDSARVSMEIKRIKILHPAWEPPGDLFDEARDPAFDTKLWELFAAGRFDDILATVQDIRTEDPTWRPSPEFAKKFEIAVTRADLVAASDAKDSATVLRLAEQRPDMLVCADVDVMWRVAESLVETDDSERAQDLYRFILVQCNNPAERVATLQKAMQLLPLPTVKALMASSGRRTMGEKEMEAVNLDLLRRQIGATISDATAPVVPAAEMRTFEALVTQRRLSNDAVMLGWQRYAQKDWKVAATWFKQAVDWDKSPKAAEGYALSLRQQGLLTEAEAAAYQWRESDPLVAKLYVEIVATALTEPKPAVFEATRLAQTEEVVAKTSSAVGAQALGWYYYNTGAFPKSGQWFAKSVAWEPTATSALGLALAASRSKDQALFKKTVAEFGSRYPAVAALQIDKTRVVAAGGRSKGQGAVRTAGGDSQAGLLAKEASELFKDGKYRDALAVLDKRAAKAPEDQGLGVLRGWALYQLSQYDKAKAQFAEMDKKSSTRDTQYGLYYSGTKLDPTHLGD
ncbi:hypothetical protein [Microvirga antarctica]|uniref:hypothetical protein n=1 Tax=Microvirga antarctica TaxID=2819233 RepID=UPI001B300318|nr:hypothetical protein [Microvirga antarctica]